jgi:C-terminal processing protease CtpA/Prc
MWKQKQSSPALVVRRGRCAARAQGVLALAVAIGLITATPVAYGQDGERAAGAGRVSSESPQRSRPRRISPLARVYLDQIIKIMRTRSLYRERVEWDDFRSRVFLAASSARTITDLYPAIEVALFLLEDPHSAYVTPGGIPFFAGVKFCRRGENVPLQLPRSIGYVKVDPFVGWEGAQEYAESIQAQIRAADRGDLAGWIVDLRGNTGGNMWPMIAGLGPLLGEGAAGYFTSITGRETAWGYADGASWVLDGRPVVSVETPYELRSAQPKVAVLTDNYVMSSGETVLVSFLGRPNTRQFGETTCGLSTSRGAFTLFDGARLYISTYHLADRDRVRYGQSIVPDNPAVEMAEAVQLAVDWLLQAE